MSNEEKILEMLEKMDQRMDRMEERMDQIDERSQRTADLLASVEDRSQQTADLLVSVEDRSQRTAVLMEADIVPKLQLLYEGHGIIMEKLRVLDDVKELAEDTKDKVDVIYAVVKQHSRDITELKKAQ